MENSKICARVALFDVRDGELVSESITREIDSLVEQIKPQLANLSCLSSALDLALSEESESVEYEGIKICVGGSVIHVES